MQKYYKRNEIAESILTEEQNGSRKGCSCLDCVFTTTQVIEKRKEFNLRIWPSYVI